MRFLYLLLFNTLCITAFAQNGAIKGKITSQDGQGASSVNVQLKEINAGTVTDENGSYYIRHIKAGKYTLVTSFVGLESQEKSVTVTEGEVSEVNFLLVESAAQLDAIEIKSSRGLNENSTSIGKVAINPMDLPQSVMVIDHAVLDRQQVLSVSDVLMNTNGVYVMGTTAGSQIEIAGRGFAYNSNNTFKNGVRFNNGITPEMSSLERVEVMKGSNAILFGQVGAGGIINFVTKKPKFQQGGEFSFRTGSYSFYKPTLDLYGAVNNSEHVAFRINSSYENAGSFRDGVKSERIYFNPSFLIKAGKKTDILVEGDYLRDNRNLDFGTASINYSIANLPRNRYLNTSWAYYKAQQKSTTITINHQLSQNWKIQVVGSYQGYSQDQYGTTRPNGNSHFVRTDGTWVRGLLRSGTSQDYYLAQANVTGKFNTGFVEHTLLVGGDVDQYKNTTLAYTYVNPLVTGKDQNIYDSINVYNLSQYKQRNDIPDIALTGITRNPINRFGVFIQDHVSITEKIKVLAGIRYSYVDNRSTVYKPDNTISVAPTKAFPSAFNPRVGLVFQPIRQVSLFASYANSFELNTGTDNKGSALAPSTYDQYEAGIKNELFKGLLALNVTAYRIVNNNFAQTILPTASNYNATYPAAKELAGEVTSKGIELDVMSKSYHGVSVIAGYSFNDTRYTKSNVYINNSRLRYNPQHTANMSIYYTFEEKFLRGLNLGFTSLYVGDRVAGRSTRTNVSNDTYKLMTIPNYFQFDFSAGYTVNHVTLRLKISNLFNQLSYNVHDDNSVNPIAPRLYSATVSYKF
ncbi:MAG TPA: TonB-dependent receptor [Cyclobacteriaceae bacterium]|nr:TonB-dependent receptor [Cyclobacteriaceae bacterium]